MFTRSNRKGGGGNGEEKKNRFTVCITSNYLFLNGDLHKIIHGIEICICVFFPVFIF